MAVYTTVSWQPGDEVTSAKLQQMCQNEEWLKDNLIIGNSNFPANGNGDVASGRQPGIIAINKIEVVSFKYDSTIPRKWYDAQVRYPPTFTEPPITIFSTYSVWNEPCCWLLDGTRTSRGIFRISDQHGRSVRHQGELNILLIGT
jgi:hypothetical protein